MKKIYQKERISRAVARSCHRNLLERLPVELFLTEYDEGELISAQQENHLLQIVVDGALSIYYVRHDGSSYSLAYNRKDSILGEVEFLGGEAIGGVFAEVTQKLTCLAFSTLENREALLSDAALLRMIAESLIGKIQMITMHNAAQPSLRERVCAFMRYKCEDNRLKGVESAAFQLHCSPRQLQRILNALAAEGRVRKTGKGCYELVGEALSLQD